MSIDTQRVWLTEETYDRARIELTRLRMERATGSRREYADEEQRARRMRELQDLISSAVVGHEPPNDGIAEPGMVLTVRYEADDLTDRFLLADREVCPDGDFSICSPHSPLGKALCGASAGDRRELDLPGGDVVTVTLLNAVPFNTSDRARTR